MGKQNKFKKDNNSRAIPMKGGGIEKKKATGHVQVPKGRQNQSPEQKSKQNAQQLQGKGKKDGKKWDKPELKQQQKAPKKVLGNGKATNGQAKSEPIQQNGKNKANGKPLSEVKSNNGGVKVVEVPAGKKTKAQISKASFNPKVDFAPSKKGKAKKVEVDEDSDESLDEELSDEELDAEDLDLEDLEGEEFEFEDSDDEEEEVEVIPEKSKKDVEKTDAKSKVKKSEVDTQKTEKPAETKAAKRAAEPTKADETKKPKLDDASIIEEQERRRQDRDAKALVVIMEGKQKKVSDSMIKALHPDILNVVRTRRVAFLHFASEAITQKAYAVIGKARLVGKPVKVDFCGEKSKRSRKTDEHEQGTIDKNRIVITGLPKDLKKDKIQVIFPKAKEVYMDFKKQMAFLRFDSHADAREAFDKGKNLKIGGAPVVVQYRKMTTKSEAEVSVKPTEPKKPDEKKEVKKQEKPDGKQEVKKQEKAEEVESDDDVDDEDLEGLDLEDVEGEEFEDESEEDDEE